MGELVLTQPFLGAISALRERLMFDERIDKIA
jgi:hypothetical protein